MKKDRFSLRKGSLARLTLSDDFSETFSVTRSNAKIFAFRLMNAKELEEQENYIRMNPIDDGGEPRIRNRWTFDELQQGCIVIITKARCVVTTDWGSSRGRAEVFEPISGNVYYIHTSNIKKLENEFVDTDLKE